MGNIFEENKEMVMKRYEETIRRKIGRAHV